MIIKKKMKRNKMISSKTKTFIDKKTPYKLTIVIPPSRSGLNLPHEWDITAFRPDLLKCLTLNKKYNSVVYFKKMNDYNGKIIYVPIKIDILGKETKIFVNIR